VINMEAALKYEDLVERLKRLDEDVYLLQSINDNFERITCIIVGGGALVLMQCIDRATSDIDLINCPKEILELLERHNFNCRVQSFIDNYPVNYADRCNKVDIETKIIDYYVTSLEDIVIAKLTSNRPKDHIDVQEQHIIERIDWERLEQLAEEIRETLLSDNTYLNFKSQYDYYVGRYKSCN
jgi:Cys-tRNA synthase (O-phospho-L-seryl-tRNA:Cys-tRNA synthase)